MFADPDFVKSVVDHFNATESTVRKTAKYFGISKSSVHYYLTKKLPNKTSAAILARNKAECCKRGREAMQRKYQERRSQ